MARLSAVGAREALHGQRESLETLAIIRQTMGSVAFSAQYQQDPLPLEGGIIKWSWFLNVDILPERQPGDAVTQSWDTASKSDEIHDFSVCTTWLYRDGKHYLVHVDRDRLNYPALKQRIINLHQRYQADTVLIEDRGSGIQLVQDLHDANELKPKRISPEKDKVTRMFAQSAKIEAGQVVLPKDAPWLDAFQNEILAFPHGRHDDQVDSLSQYLGWFRSPTSFSIDDCHIVVSETARAYRNDPMLGGYDTPPWDMGY